MKSPQGKESTISGFSRRQFVGVAAAAAAFTFVPRRVLGGAGQSSANGKLNIAGIGVGGRGASDIEGVSSENIVALCDADLSRAGGTIKKYPGAKVYRDFREMLEKEDKNIDAVVIGAPDHIHAPASIMAMKMGKHVYCEKPMAHTIFEARRMAEVAGSPSGVDRRMQGGPTGGRQERILVRRAVYRGLARRQPGRAAPEARRMGFQGNALAELPRGRQLRHQVLSRGF